MALCRKGSFSLILFCINSCSAHLPSVCDWEANWNWHQHWVQGKLRHLSHFHTSSAGVKFSRDVPERWHVRKQITTTSSPDFTTPNSTVTSAEDHKVKLSGKGSLLKAFIFCECLFFMLIKWNVRLSIDIGKGRKLLELSKKNWIYFSWSVTCLVPSSEFKGLCWNVNSETKTFNLNSKMMNRKKHKLDFRLGKSNERHQLEIEMNSCMNKL